MNLDISKLKDFINQNFNNNISKASIKFRIPKDTLSKILRQQRQAGMKTINKLIEFCLKNGYSKDFFMQYV